MNAEEICSRGKRSKPKTEEEIGRLKMDIKWLEKKLLACRYQPEGIGWCRVLIIPSGGNVDWQAYQDPVFTMNLHLRQRMLYLMCLIDEQYLRPPEFGFP